MSLQSEIDIKRKEIHTESYPMSIGELMSLYTESEMDIHPEFQRFFRWTQSQKSKLIESILLGIPIPPIFVSQRSNGVWDVIDGLQRLSTIFEFAGILKNEQKELIPSSTLIETDYLPSLAGKKWENPDEDEEENDNYLTRTQRLLIKRARLDVSIVQKESDSDTKYELFQRLNTGGTPLEPQEVRNCILVMLNVDFYRWLKELSEDRNFQSCIPLTERQKEEQFGVELVLRFFIYKNSSTAEIKSIKDIGDFINKKMIEFAKSNTFNYVLEKEIFERTFEVLSVEFGEDAFKKYVPERDSFLGAFSISAYEVIASGVSKNIDKYWESINSYKNLDQLSNKVKQVWNNDIFIQRSGSGTRASTRLPYFIPLGEEMFAL